MRTIEQNIYRYSELNINAKERVKQWYLEGQDNNFFYNNCFNDLKELFGCNELELQYSLSYSQGDGFNIFGKINGENIIDTIINGFGWALLSDFETVLSEKEQRTIKKYAKECSCIELPYNNRYCYSLANQIEFAENWICELENCNFSNINKAVIYKFERLVRDIFSEICEDFKESGYKYFYEIDEYDLENWCTEMEYELFENGELYC